MTTDKEKAKTLSDLELYNVQMGVDGTEDIHDTIRGVKGAWKETYNAIYHLLDAEIPVTAIFTVMRSNVSVIEAYIDYMKAEKFTGKPVHTMKIVDYITSLSYEDLPSDAVLTMKATVLNLLGCALAGSKYEHSNAIVDYVRAQGCNEE